MCVGDEVGKVTGSMSPLHCDNGSETCHFHADDRETHKEESAAERIEHFKSPVF